MGARFEIRKSRKRLKQRYYVVTIGNNNEPLQTSEMFPTKQECHTNIQAMRRIVGMIGVVDTTSKDEDA